jgi:hypothetical protein
MICQVMMLLGVLSTRLTVSLQAVTTILTKT